jgi:hypothetical protein
VRDGRTRVRDGRTKAQKRNSHRCQPSRTQGFVTLVTTAESQQKRAQVARRPSGTRPLSQKEVPINSMSTMRRACFVTTAFSCDTEQGTKITVRWLKIDADRETWTTRDEERPFLISTRRERPAAAEKAGHETRLEASETVTVIRL